MKACLEFEIIENKMIAKDVYQMVLKGDTTWISRPGQFVNFTIENCYLKRPISICDFDDDSFMCIYKVVGKGTKIMSTYLVGHKVSCLVGLGNGFNLDETGKDVVLIGGGVGVPPMYGLAKKCIVANKNVSVILGFGSKQDSFYIEEFKKLNIPVYVSTNDGSLGDKGFVTDLMKKYNLTNTFYMACGPMGMLKAIHGLSSSKGLLSFEERMGCGFGACMGCSCETSTGYKRICVEGPVLQSEEILWKN